MMAGGQHFFQGSSSRKCFIDTIFQQGTHPMQTGLAADGLRRLALEGHLADERIHTHHFKDANTPPITRMVAMTAPTSAHECGILELLWRQASCLDFDVGWLIRSLTFGADNPHQSLGHNGNDGRCDKERLYANIDQTCNSAGRIVRM